MRHKHTGVITSIGDSYSSPDHVRISIAHGAKKRPKKGDGNMVGYGDNRPSSEIHLPRAHAKHYSIGQKVNVGLGPSGTDAETSYRNTVKSIIHPKKKS